jgi:hypothetical protein
MALAIELAVASAGLPTAIMPATVAAVGRKLQAATAAASTSVISCDGVAVLTVPERL